MMIGKRPKTWKEAVVVCFKVLIRCSFGQAQGKQETMWTAGNPAEIRAGI
jgi:hypothetical protein